MLSILIPIYNQDVTALVQQLTVQASKLTCAYEIRCYDDGSIPEKKKPNHALAGTESVVYLELPTNVGRARIRNRLAEDASYDWLLFMDGDSEVEKKDYLTEYLKHTDTDVINGGRNYHKKKPTDKDLMLHWTYGIERESQTSEARTAHPLRYFHSNNFMIRKSVWKQVRFDEEIAGYGYEDLLFAQQLSDQGFIIKHIDNPVIHIGLEHEDDFLSKTKRAVHNLIILEQKGQQLDTKLSKAARRIQGSGLSGLYLKWYLYKESGIMENLISDQPMLRNLDHYKLYHYLTESRKRDKKW